MKKKLKKKPTSHIKNLEDFLDTYYPELTPGERAKRIVMAEIRVALDKYSKTVSSIDRIEYVELFAEILNDMRGFGA